MLTLLRFEPRLDRRLLVGDFPAHICAVAYRRTNAAGFACRRRNLGNDHRLFPNATEGSSCATDRLGFVDCRHSYGISASDTVPKKQNAGRSS